MQSARRVNRAFNPTSLPGLRAPRIHTRDLYSSGKLPRTGQQLKVDGALKGLRRESTQTGEDQTGHIAASSNEAILFFDGTPLPSCA